MGTLFSLGPQVLARVGDWFKEQMNKGNRVVRPHFMLGAVNMDCRGLVDPQNKPFGHVLPLEVQVRIMFWVDCIITNEKRQKVNEQFEELPKCNLTGWPQCLGEYHWWNQVVFRLHAPNGSTCHHCHRIVDHRLSVRKNCFGGDGLNKG